MRLTRALFRVSIRLDIQLTVKNLIDYVMMVAIVLLSISLEATMWLRYSVFFVFGFIAGFGTLLALFLVYGDYGEQSTVQIAPSVAAVAPTVQSDNPPAAIPQVTGPSYEAVCDADTNNMTDPQIAAFAEQWIGQRFSGWQGFVYDVVSRSDGTYNLEIAMEERGLFWSRNIVIENIVSDLALRLNVEQPITFSGRILRNETFLDGLCNPLVVEDYVLQD